MGLNGKHEELMRVIVEMNVGGKTNKGEGHSFKDKDNLLVKN